MDRKEKILIIDDDIAITSTIDYLLNKKYTIDVTFSGENAIRILKRDSYPVLLLDINLQDMSGLDLLKQIKNLNIPSEVIMLTGNESVNVAVDTMKAGAFDYISKPFVYDDLDSCITKALAAYLKKTRVITRDIIIDTLRKHNGNKVKTAKTLDIDLSLLFKKIVEFQISPSETQ